MGKVNKLKNKAKKALASAALSQQNSKQQFKRHLNNDGHDDGDDGGNDDGTGLLHKVTPTRNTISKGEKMQRKHKKLLNKFTLIRKQQKEERARKNREKTAIIGDLQPLKDALPSLAELMELSKERGNLKTGLNVEPINKGKLTARGKIKAKKELFIRKVNAFEALLNDPDFKKNPRDAISYHINYTNGLIDNE